MGGSMKRTTFIALSLSISVAFIAVANEFLEKGNPGGQKSLNPAPGNFGTVPDEIAPELDAEVVFTGSGTEKAISGKTVSTSQKDKSVVLAKNGSCATVSKSRLEKNGGDSSNDGQSNFYGLNGAVVAQEAASLSLDHVTVTSSADGANAVFATGEDSVIVAKNLTVHTTKDSSRGLDATYGGEIRAEKVDILTEGAHCAAFATDRGEGKVTVKGGKAETKGQGSPIIYSTGDITVKNLTGMASGSEIACIEGKNSIQVEKSRLTGGVSRGIGNDVASVVMLYQSMSGDANQGTARFISVDSTLESHASGPFFYVTNTKAEVSLSKTNLRNTASSVLIQASGNNSERGWGRRGANGGQLVLQSVNQVLEGNVVVDAISSIDLNFGSGTKFSGAINASNAGTVNLKLDSKAFVTLNADSFVNELKVDSTDFKNIKSCGYTLFYNKNATANAYLKGRTYLLSDGGKVCATDKITLSSEASSSEKGKPGFGAPGGGKPGMGNGAKEGSAKSASDMMGKKLEMPKLSTYTGTISVSSDSVMLQTEDSKTLLLAVMESPERNGKGGPGEDSRKMGGMPPSPPNGAPGDMGNGPRPDSKEMGKEGKEPPQRITLEDLKKLKGKKVEIQGVIGKDGKLTVITAEEK